MKKNLTVLVFDFEPHAHTPRRHDLLTYVLLSINNLQESESVDVRVRVRSSVTNNMHECTCITQRVIIYRVCNAMMKKMRCKTQYWTGLRSYFYFTHENFGFWIGDELV